MVASDGKLKKAGTEREIPVTATYSKESGSQKISFTGSVSIKMTDFNISPPTAMFGTMKTGDEVTIEYKIIVEHT
ncbi:MAG: YceI family protein [Marinoscillum sp.]